MSRRPLVLAEPVIAEFLGGDLEQSWQQFRGPGRTARAFDHAVLNLVVALMKLRAPELFP